MKIIGRWSRLRLVLVGALVGGLLAGGVAYATLPGSDNVIHGCYQNSTGALRVIDLAADHCRKDETTLDWNQQGPTGPPGVPGSQGPPGPAGSDGGSALYAHVFRRHLDMANTSPDITMTVVQGPYLPTYCFSLPSTPTYAIATSDMDNGFGLVGSTIASSQAWDESNCPEGTQAAASGSDSLWVVFGR